MTTSAGIYAITNNKNMRMYIGSTIRFNKRWAKHKNTLQKGCHFSKHLQSAFNKYGKSAFDFTIVEYVDAKDSLLSREQVWIDFFKPTYNKAKFAGAPSRGQKMSLETRQKMSISAKKHKPNNPWTPELRLARSIEYTGKKYPFARRPYLIGNTRSAGHNIGNKYAAGTEWTAKMRAEQSCRVKLIWTQEMREKQSEKIRLSWEKRRENK